MKTGIKIVLLLLIVTFSLSGESIDEFSDILNNSVSRWLNGEIDSSRVIYEMTGLENKLELEVVSKEILYLRAKTALIRGQVWLQEENSEKSIAELEKCRTLAGQSLEYGEYSDGWRLISEAGSFIMLQKGVGYIIKNSKFVQEQSEKALELNQSNARASIIIAQGLINAPALFGGSKKKGIAILEEQKMRADITDEDMYYVLLALSDVYKTMKKNNDALVNYYKILELYPGSSYVQSLIDSLND